MGICYGTAGGRNDLQNLKASDELSRKIIRKQSSTSALAASKTNSEDLQDEFLTKKVMIPVNILRTKESMSYPYFKVTESVANLFSSMGNVGRKLNVHKSAQEASNPETGYWDRTMSFRRHNLLQEIGYSMSNVSKSSPACSPSRMTKRERQVTKVEDPIPISSFGELTDDKPLRFFAHDDWSCSLSIRATSFEMLWDHGDSVIPTPQSIIFKTSKQRSPKFWITGSVIRECKAFILNPEKLIVSICGVEIGLAKQHGGLLPPIDRTYRSRPGDTPSSLQTQSLLVPSMFGDNYLSSLSYGSITPSWFACEGFLLHSTSLDEKEYLEDMFTTDIADVLWQFLPESKFKDRAKSTQYEEEKPLKDMEMFKSFKVVASSIKEVVVSGLDLDAVVRSNFDAASATIHLSDLNGRYVSPHWPLSPRKKIKPHWGSDHLLPTTDRKQSLLSDKNFDQGDMKTEFPCMKNSPKWQSFNRNTKISFRNANYIALTGDKSQSRNCEKPSSASSFGSNYLTRNRERSDSTTYMGSPSQESRAAQELRCGVCKTSSSLTSELNLGTLLNEGLDSEHPAHYKEHAISHGEQTSGFNGEVTISTDQKAPQCITCTHTQFIHLTPNNLLELIDAFETRVRDAVLEDISSEENQCRWVADDGTNEKMYLSEITKEVHRKRIKRAEQKAEDQSRRMEIMLCPGGFSQHMMYNEMEFVVLDPEYSADTYSESSITKERRC